MLQTTKKKMKEVYYTGRAWKHHRVEDFDRNPLKYANASKGGTIFLDYDKMIQYLKMLGGHWYICELILQDELVCLNHNQSWMVDVTRSIPYERGFESI